MIITLWGIIVYLLIGTIIYYIALDMLEERDPRNTIHSYNQVQLLSLVFLWLPMLFYALFCKQ
jgi:hypothetical protein